MQKRKLVMKCHSFVTWTPYLSKRSWCWPWNFFSDDWAFDIPVSTVFFAKRYKSFQEVFMQKACSILANHMKNKAYCIQIKKWKLSCTYEKLSRTYCNGEERWLKPILNQKHKLQKINFVFIFVIVNVTKIRFYKFIDTNLIVNIFKKYCFGNKDKCFWKQ